MLLKSHLFRQKHEMSDLDELVKLRDEFTDKIQSFKTKENNLHALMDDEDYILTHLYLAETLKLIYERSSFYPEGEYLLSTDFKRHYILHKNPKKFHKAITNKAAQLCKDERFDEALTLIDIALEYDSFDFANYNIKAIILEGLSHPSRALENYDLALKYFPDCDYIRFNKAELLYKRARGAKDTDPDNALKFIDEAMEIHSELSDDYEYRLCMGTKSSILYKLSRLDEAYVYDVKSKSSLSESQKEKKIRTLRKHMALFKKYSDNTLICITGPRFYKGYKIFKKGVVVDLVREYDNKYDSDAIAVEIDGETVGHVANSAATLFDKVKSASDIKDIISDNQQAEVLFIFIDRYIVARLIDDDIELFNDRFKELNDFASEMDSLIDSVKDY